MIRLNRLAALGGLLALTLLAGNGAAAPLGQGADAILKASAGGSTIERVHGCHRACVLGRVPRWGGVIRFHRHVGPNCVPVRC
ncbi:MAG: hypothetical protein IT537_15415 [Hyphomicrobiales bacterium]|nr:hypothetical protein [Hyphomicrobiales bacterium]